MRKALSVTVQGLVLLVATGVFGLWVRSYAVSDSFRWLVKPSFMYQTIGTVPGGLYAHRSNLFL